MAKILEGPAIKSDIGKKCIGQFFFDMATKYGDKICQVHSITDEKETYSSVKKRSVRVALQMLKRGVKSGDVIVVCSHNTIDNIIPMLASTFIGAQIANLDPSMAVRDVKHLLGIIKPKIVFAEDSSLNLIEKSIEDLQTQIVVLGTSSVYPSFSEFLQPVEGENEFKPTESQLGDSSFIFFSSGTTGLPKAICISNRSLVNIANGALDRGVQKDGVALHFTTFYWVSAVFVVIEAFVQGGCRVIVPQFNAENTFQIIEKYKVTTAVVATGLTFKLTDVENASKYDISSLRFLMIVGGSLPPAQLKKTRSVFNRVFVIFCYAMTETAMVTIFDPRRDLELLKVKLSSCGKPSIGVKIKVVDPETGRMLEPNQRGEICCKTNGLMIGYFNADSSQVFDEDGFLKTGDIGYYDEDDCFYVVDRIKEMFKYKSWHIVPASIEAVILEHPAVSEAVVFGIRAEEDDEIPAACVVLRENADVSAEEIEKFVAERVLDREKLRGGVKIIDHILKTPTGKLLRKQTRDLAFKILQ